MDQTSATNQASSPRVLAALVLAAALALAACGGEPPDPRAGAVTYAVESFAAAEDAEACELLTQPALERLYGGLESCVERSRDFEAGEVEVDKVTISASGTRASARARSLSGKREFAVVARLVPPPGCREPCPTAGWRIDEVKPG